MITIKREAPEGQTELAAWLHTAMPLQPTAEPQPLLAPTTSGLPKTFFPPKSGVDPQLYVTITISIIIVLVATGIIFKFW